MSCRRQSRVAAARCAQNRPTGPSGPVVKQVRLSLPCDLNTVHNYHQHVTIPGQIGNERVLAYVDGLNVYQGMSSKGWRTLLWLDYRSLCEDLLFESQELVGVKYFTAHRRNPPESYVRQETYFRALDANGGVERIEGKFEKNKLPCIHCGRMTESFRERRTDVNLAAHLVGDASHDRFDTALLVSGDSDFIEPVVQVQALGKKVKLARPPARRSTELASACDHMMDIRKNHLSRNQLPHPVAAPDGAEIRCPHPWLNLSQKIELMSEANQEMMRAITGATHESLHSSLHALADRVLGR